MEWVLLLKALVSLLFVLGLMLLTLWVFKYLEMNSAKCRLFKKLSEKKRISLVELRRIDTKNSVVLVQCDDKEYLLLLGASNLVLDSKIAKKNTEDMNDEK